MILTNDDVVICEVPLIMDKEYRRDIYAMIDDA